MPHKAAVTPAASEAINRACLPHSFITFDLVHTVSVEFPKMLLVPGKSLPVHCGHNGMLGNATRM